MLDRLTEIEQGALVELLELVAKADGDISKQEREFLDKYSKAIGASWNKGSADMNIDGVLSKFETYQSKMIVIIEMMRLAYIDGDYSDAERAGVAVIAEKMSISSKTLELAEGWMVRGINWINDGESLVSQPVT